MPTQVKPKFGWGNVILICCIVAAVLVVAGSVGVHFYDKDKDSEEHNPTTTPEDHLTAFCQSTIKFKVDEAVTLVQQEHQALVQQGLSGEDAVAGGPAFYYAGTIAPLAATPDELQGPQLDAVWAVMKATAGGEEVSAAQLQLAHDFESRARSPEFCGTN